MAGSPLMDVIDMGCERLAFAADALNIVIKELKQNCNDGSCKLMVICDGVNSLFAEQTLVHKEKKEWKNGPYFPDHDYVKNSAKVLSPKMETIDQLLKFDIIVRLTSAVC